MSGTNVFFDGQQAVDTVNDLGLGGFSNKSQFDLEKQYGALEIIPLAEAAARIETRACTGATEIRYADWQEMLEILPPLKWVRTEDAESFRIREATTGNVHSSFVRLGKRYFRMQRPLSETHEQLVGIASIEMLASRRRNN